MSQPEIITIEDSISVVKDNCTRVNYFIFNEYEIHLNTIPSGAVQEWHFHSKLEESILILTGELLLSWQDHGQIYNQLLKEGTIVRVKLTIPITYRLQ